MAQGDIPFYGKSGLDFYTQRKVSLPAFLSLQARSSERAVADGKTTTALWPHADATETRASVSMPQIH